MSECIYYLLKYIRFFLTNQNLTFNQTFDALAPTLELATPGRVGDIQEQQQQPPLPVRRDKQNRIYNPSKSHQKLTPFW